MRLFLLLGLVLVTACPSPQPGCTAENCRLMVEACRVEFNGGPADLATCTGFDRPPGKVDFSSYCVDACNAHAGSGAVASCLASKADACRDAGSNFTQLDQLLSSCAGQGGQAPDKACDDRCVAERRTCDDACSGGRPCDSCLRAGGPDCASVCTDAGWKACLDCSGRCGVKYVACRDGCPRAP